MNKNQFIERWLFAPAMYTSMDDAVLNSANTTEEGFYNRLFNNEIPENLTVTIGIRSDYGFGPISLIDYFLTEDQSYQLYQRWVELKEKGKISPDILHDYLRNKKLNELLGSGFEYVKFTYDV